MRWTAIAFLLGVNILSSAIDAIALEGRFDRPTYKGGPARLDVCQHFGKECGKPAADDFCRIMGYERANKFESEHASPTRVIVFGQECNGPGCVAFKFIVCFTSASERGKVKDWPAPMDR